MQITYMDMDPNNDNHPYTNGPYVLGKWAIIDGCTIVISGFSDEWKAIDYVRKHIGSKIADELEREFKDV